MKCPHCGREIELWKALVQGKTELPTVKSSSFLGEHLKKKNRNLRRWSEQKKP